jgi:DNA-binding NarL/FixJ family response regulator
LRRIVGGWEEKIRVLIVDDDPNFVEAATALLAADQRLEVVGGAGNGERSSWRLRSRIIG